MKPTFSIPRYISKVVSEATDGATLFSKTLIENLKKSDVNVIEHDFENILNDSPSEIKKIMSPENYAADPKNWTMC